MKDALRVVGNTPGHGVGIDTFGLQRLSPFIGFLGLAKHLLGEIAVT